MFAFRPSAVRRRVACAAAVALTLGLSPAVASAADPVLDLENLTGPQAEKMMQDGELTSVQLTRAYIKRIDALNKRGPGLNAVSQLNKDALREAAAFDRERAAGTLRGPAHGLPILLKDLIDVKGMYTSAGNYSLRNSFPETDSGIVKKLRASGVVILGKLGLTEFANSFGSQPSGFSNLTGQVLNAVDADQNPSGSSSGSGSAGAAALSALTIGTETSGSIISPSAANGLVGLRPTVGLVPGYGIAPISASQDTAGPMDRTVANVALNLQSISGPDPDSDVEYRNVFGPNYDDVVPPIPSRLPNYSSALDLNFVKGRRIGYNLPAIPTPPTEANADARAAILAAKAALEAAGAIVEERPQTSVSVGDVPLPSGYEQHKTIDEYYARLGSSVPIKSLAEEIRDNNANAMEALKFGNASHVNAQASDTSAGSANETQYRTNVRERKRRYHKAIDDMLNNQTPNDTSDDFIAILGSVPSGPQAGYPQVTIPMGYNATQRRALNVSVNGGAYSERDLIGVAYVIEQGTKKRQPVSAVNPSMYRCAKTVPAPPYSARGACNPDYDTIMAKVGTAPTLPFSLETESMRRLQERLSDGSLSSETLTKAYLARIALTNAEGPATAAVRSVNLDAIDRAKALDAERQESGSRGPLHGLPVLVDDSIDVAGTPTTAGSIALQGSVPTRDAKLVSKLKTAGAIVLGKANVTELNGLFDSNVPEGYSSLGGQVLLPSDTDKTPAGSSGGSAAGTASGLAAATVGLETSTDTAQLIAPAGVAGVVGLKPTVGRVSRAGVLGVAKSQDSPGPIARTVYDAATSLQVMAGQDAADSATTGAPTPPDYVAGLSANALDNKRIAVLSSTPAAVVSTLEGAGARTTVRTVGTPSPNPASIVTREFKRDLNAYLAGVPGGGAKSLQAIIDYNAANPVEGLKYQQRELTDAQAVDLSDSATSTQYQSDRDTGRMSNQQVIDNILNNGTPTDTSDDFDVIVAPSGTSLVGNADRAGYPLLTVPSSFGTGTAGRNPVGVTFVGTAFSEDRLLADGYAYELASRVRLAPSFTNPSMFRCVPGSTFFSPHECNPGDRLFTSPVLEPLASDAGATGGTGSTGSTNPTGSTTPAGSTSPTGTGPGGSTTPTTSKDVDQRKALLASVIDRLKLKDRTLSVTDTFVTPGRVSYRLELSFFGTKAAAAAARKPILLGKATATITKAGKRKVTIRLSRSARRAIRKYRKARVVLKTTFVSTATKKTLSTVRTVKR